MNERADAQPVEDGYPVTTIADNTTADNTVANNTAGPPPKPMATPEQITDITGFDRSVDSPLVDAARMALQKAAAVLLDDEQLLVEERNTWQPMSWLIQSVWETLADVAADGEALTVAGWLADRQPTARLQALYRLARQLVRRPALGPLLQHELQQWQHRLFHTHPEEAKQIERLLLVATSAALIEDYSVAAACLERLDNLPKGWERIVARADLREQLTLCLVHIGPHPLVNDLINIAIRRFDDAGAQFLYAITTLLNEQIALEQTTTVGSTAMATSPPLSKSMRLMNHCLDTLRLSTLVTPQSRRIATMIFAQAGQVDEVLTQIETIERVQAAQRDTGYHAESEDGLVLRQVETGGRQSRY